MGIGHHMKLNSKEDEHTWKKPYKKTGRKPYRKKISQEFNLTGRWHNTKTTLKKTGRRPYWKMILASQSCTELGPDQPQL